MASTLVKSPTALGTISEWTNPTNAYSSNNVYATATYSQEQTYKTFSLSLPSGTAINGIIVNVEAKAAIIGQTIRVKLSYDNGTSWTSTESKPFALSDATQVYGGSTDTWGRTWTDTELNNTNFQVHLEPPSIGSSLSVDNITVQVYYGTDNSATFNETVTPTDTKTASTSASKSETATLTEVYNQGIPANMSDEVSSSDEYSAQRGTTKSDESTTEDVFATIRTYLRDIGDSVAASDSTELDFRKSFSFENVVFPMPHGISVVNSERGTTHRSITGNGTWDVSNEVDIIKLQYETVDLSNTQWQTVLSLYDAHLTNGTPIYFESGIIDYAGYVIMDISEVSYLHGHNSNGDQLVSFTITLTASEDI
jgi:hypothetical protein